MNELLKRDSSEAEDFLDSLAPSKPKEMPFLATDAHADNIENPESEPEVTGDDEHRVEGDEGEEFQLDPFELALQSVEDNEQDVWNVNGEYVEIKQGGEIQETEEYANLNMPIDEDEEDPYQLEIAVTGKTEDELVSDQNTKEKKSPKSLFAGFMKNKHVEIKQGGEIQETEEYANLNMPIDEDEEDPYQLEIAVTGKTEDELVSDQNTKEKKSPKSLFAGFMKNKPQAKVETSRDDDDDDDDDVEPFIGSVDSTDQSNASGIERNNAVEVKPSPAQTQVSISVIAALALGLLSTGISTYTLFEVKRQYNQNSIVHELRGEVVARMDKIEEESGLKIKQLTKQLSEKEEQLEAMRSEQILMTRQLQDFKSVSERMSADNELSLTWSRQTRTLAENTQQSFDGYNEQLGKLTAEVKALSSKVGRVSQQQSAAAQKIASNQQEQSLTVDGYTMYGIEDWGGVLLVTLVKGDEVKRVQMGDQVGPWLLDRADTKNRVAHFVQGTRKLSVGVSR